MDWELSFLDSPSAMAFAPSTKSALIILNQPFSFSLLHRLWTNCQWRVCADGGANRLYEVTHAKGKVNEYLPDLIKGDLDSLRDDVREYYASQDVQIIQEADQYSTDLMKCVSSLEEKEIRESVSTGNQDQSDIIILGGLSGRLDQTIHTLSYLYKLRKKRKRVFAITDDNVGWVLDEGEHHIHINHSILGQTVGFSL